MPTKKIDAKHAQALWVGLTTVEITPGIIDELHYHISNVIGFVIAGKGRLRWKGRGKNEHSETVDVGDVVSIPAGVLHSFDAVGTSTMLYVAVEYGDTKIDYQKHHVDTSK